MDHATLPSEPAWEGRAHRSPSGFLRGPAGPAALAAPFSRLRLWLRCGVQERPGRGGTPGQLGERLPPTPSPAYPPVSAPESTQSSSSSPPALRSMARSDRGHRRDLGRAPSGPPSPGQPELAGVPASVSRSRLGQTTPAPPAVRAPRPLLAASGLAPTAASTPPLAAGRVSTGARGCVRAPESVCTGCERVCVVCACARGCGCAQEGVCTVWEHACVDVHMCASSVSSCVARLCVVCVHERERCVRLCAPCLWCDVGEREKYVFVGAHVCVRLGLLYLSVLCNLVWCVCAYGNAPLPGAHSLSIGVPGIAPRFPARRFPEPCCSRALPGKQRGEIATSL